MKMQNRPHPMANRGRMFVLGIAGGSGSGKTTVVDALLKSLGTALVSVLQHDAYYHNRPELSYEERCRINFDHPDALETELMAQHLEQLLAGKRIEMPIYDFTRHLRAEETRTLSAKPILIVDGILVLHELALRKHMDLKVFVDVDSDLRLLRRLERDLRERGRNLDSVIGQYLETVRPMHIKYVEPSRTHADILIPGGGHNREAFKLLLALLKSLQPRDRPAESVNVANSHGTPLKLH